MDNLIIQDANVVYYPNMDLAKNIFLYDSDIQNGKKNDVLKQEILNELESSKIVAVYQQFASKYDWTIDSDLINLMTDANSKSLERLDKKLAEAIEMGGETEIMESLFTKARFYTQIGQWTEASSVYDEILSKPKSSTGKKIDAMMEKSRISFFNMEITKLKDLLSEAKKLSDVGGDWDRRNRLKVYEAISMLITRDFKQAAPLFIDGIATFACVELCTYDQFIFYAILICIISLPRTELYKKIICNPQILAVIRNQPLLQNFLQSLYKCDYKTFYQSLTPLYAAIVQDRYLSPHVRYLMKECRVLAYSQFLEAYKSVLITSMADSFGITVTLLDHELSHFISVGRLTAKIDKVGGIVVSSRADTKNAQYQDVIKKGDVLLNHIQKLVRVIDV